MIPGLGIEETITLRVPPRWVRHVRQVGRRIPYGRDHIRGLTDQLEQMWRALEHDDVKRAAVPLACALAAGLQADTRSGPHLAWADVHAMADALHEAALEPPISEAWADNVWHDDCSTWCPYRGLSGHLPQAKVQS
jgi:hypothetical protein